MRNVPNDEYGTYWAPGDGSHGLLRGVGGAPTRHNPRYSRRGMAACLNALRSVVFIFNFIFWICGIIILGLGLWLLFDPFASDFFALHSAHPGSFRIVGWLLVAAGAIMTFMGCFGCFGAWKLSQGALLAFFFILVVVFMLELAAAVTAYNKQEMVRNYIESSMQDTIRNRYSSDSNYKAAFDTIQNEFECCGVNSYSDWLGASWDKKRKSTDGDENADEESVNKIEHGIGAVGGGSGNGYGRVPGSCCNENGKREYPSNCGVSFNHAPLSTYQEFIHNKGCANALYDAWNNNLDWIIGISVAIGSIQLIGMMLSMILCCCVNQESRSDKYSY